MEWYRELYRERYLLIASGIVNGTVSTRESLCTDIVSEWPGVRLARWYGARPPASFGFMLKI